MKKLLMSLAVLAAATGIASAATISWSAIGAAVDKDGNNLGTGAAFLVYCGANGAVDLTWDADSATWNMGDDVVVDSASISGAATTSYTGSWGYYQATTKVDTGVGAVYAVVVASEGVYPGTTLPGKEQGYYGISEIYTQAKADVTDDNIFNVASVTVDQPLPGPQGIPEPTTYALIGVAAAALALRKRFMKK